ncbi:hypothetical protein RJ640_017241 [Escallonia rubra]|uniref:Zinc finger ZPR1-type domain-containing protein n=1 Tax=Escallonia rubra TaxID=112253 RepID=A0AA88QR28_9ASTE|nr:hypothetical protein RJ640_017241 [Escallonia rubra]
MNNVSDQITREQYGTVGAPAGHRAIAQGIIVRKFLMLCFDTLHQKRLLLFHPHVGLVLPDARLECSLPIFPSYFQEVIVMASSCDGCGYRNSELKPGGCIPAKGKKVTVRVTNIGDLSRDVIKSDTAGVSIPETDLELGSGILGGQVTTIEGLITKISEGLERVHGFTFGDSIDDNRRSKWQLRFLADGFEP